MAKSTPHQPELVKTTVRALVVMEVAASKDQTAEEAAEKWLQTFADILTDDDASFREDYGTDEKTLLAWLADEDGDALEPTTGGYEGPFVLSTKVRPASSPVGDGVDWHIMMGDNFARSASTSDDPVVKAERSAQAARYYAIAAELAPLR